MNEWQTNPVGGVGATVAVVAAMLLLLLSSPRPLPSPRRLVTLKLLRLGATLMMAFALLRPALVFTKREPLEASLLLLVDTSPSMSVEDSLGGASRLDAARALLADSADSLRSLAERWSVSAYRFDGGLAALDLEDGVVRLPEEPTGEATALGSAIDDLLDREAGGRLAGVVLLTDGAQRALPPRDLTPRAAVRRLAAEGAPLFALPFGLPGSGDRADLALDDLLASDTVFAQTPTEVTARLRVQGFANRTFSVQLLWESADGEMAVVDAAQVTTVPGVGSYPLRLVHSPTEPGEWKVSLRVAPEEGELLTGNNEQSTFITVREGGVKVLQLAGAQRVGGHPGPEQRFVRAALAASPDVVVTRRVFDYRRDGADLTPLLRESAGETGFDALLLDDLDGRALDARSWRVMAERVRAGAGLMMLGGRHSFGPGGHRGSALADALPIGFGRAERQPFGEPPRRDVHVDGPLTARPTPLGRRDPLLQLGGDATLDLWSRLPPLDGANRFDAALLKPNARVLLETADADAWPLLIAGQWGEGRTLAWAGDSTWRWPMHGFADAHRRFWRQAVLWLAKKDDSSDNPVAIELATRRVPRGAPVDLTFSVRREEKQSAAAVRFEAVVTKPGGEPVDLPLPRGQAAVAATFTGVDDPGDYVATVTAYDGPTELGSATARFLAPDQDLELDNPAAEPALLAQLAAMTSAAGGRSLAPEELPDLLAELAAEPPEMSEEVTARVTPWDTWPFFLTLVGLLGVEWWLRKRWGLV